MTNATFVRIHACFLYLIATYRLDMAAGHDPEQIRWKKHGLIDGAWKHHAFRNNIVFCDLAHRECIVLQKFQGQPDLGRANMCADLFLGQRAVPIGYVVLPMRLHVPIVSSHQFNLPAAPIRSKPVPGVERFFENYRGYKYEIRLSATREHGAAPAKLSLDILLGKHYNAIDGTPRSFIYIPDARHMRGLSQADVPGLLYQVFDGVIYGLVCMSYRYGCAIDTTRRANDRRVATIENPLCAAARFSGSYPAVGGTFEFEIVR